jgi:hypothetical protein
MLVRTAHIPSFVVRPKAGYKRMLVRNVGN